MSTFSVDIEVSNPEGSRTLILDALVDTGAFYTLVSAPLLSDLGVAPQWRETFRLADGRLVELEVAEAVIGYDGGRRTTPVAFGPENCDPLLGAFTLEAFALRVDPRAQELIHIDLTL